MKVKELIKADSKTFWEYWLKTTPKDCKAVNVTPDRAKESNSRGKNRGPA